MRDDSRKIALMVPKIYLKKSGIFKKGTLIINFVDIYKIHIFPKFHKYCTTETTN
jgi:hypothetical protein